MVKLKIIKTMLKSCHLFKFFILKKLKKVYLAIRFLVLYFAVR